MGLAARGEDLAMRTYIAVLAGLAVAGCFRSSRQVMAPDGGGAWLVDCRKDRSFCFDEAQRLCPQGYFVLDSSQQSGAFAQTFASQYSATTVVTPTWQGEMMIRCRLAPAAPIAYPQPVAISPPPAGKADFLFRASDGKVYRVPLAERERAIRSGWMEVAE